MVRGGLGRIGQILGAFADWGFEVWVFLRALKGGGRIGRAGRCDDPSHDTTPNSCFAKQCAALDCATLYYNALAKHLLARNTYDALNL